MKYKTTAEARQKRRGYYKKYNSAEQRVCREAQQIVIDYRVAKFRGQV